MAHMQRTRKELNRIKVTIKLWSSQLWTQLIYAITYIEGWKIQDFHGVWTRDLVIDTGATL